MFAAWQANAGYDAPTLEYRTAAGRWVALLEKFGYPARMPRQAAVPLPRVPAGTRHFRLRTNLEIYWDRIVLAATTAAAASRKHSMMPAAARVSQPGFARRSTGPQRQPSYHYADRRPFWDTRYPAGFYTAVGEATALLENQDDALAIIGPGEELELRYADNLPALAAGWTRRFVLEIHGWAKDMDLYTQHGGTVGPLPTTGKPSEVASKLHARFNTRYLSGR